MPYLFLFLLAPLFILSGCASGPATGTYSPNNSIYASGERIPQSDKIDKGTEEMLKAAESVGNKQEMIAILKRIYNAHPDDPAVAVRYARILREDDQIAAAERILTPFTQGAKTNEDALTEMAMTQLALGEFEEAEKFAQKAIDKDDKNARAYLALGTAQDGQAKHEEAELAFREGIKHWKGDATPIMNNLALNLASQGHLQQALTLIETAQAKAPHRMDLERNRRIIATLLETAGPSAPAPGTKPDITPAAQ